MVGIKFDLFPKQRCCRRFNSSIDIPPEGKNKFCFLVYPKFLVQVMSAIISHPLFVHFVGSIRSIRVEIPGANAAFCTVILSFL